MPSESVNAGGADQPYCLSTVASCTVADTATGSPAVSALTMMVAVSETSFLSTGALTATWTGVDQFPPGPPVNVIEPGDTATEPAFVLARFTTTGAAGSAPSKTTSVRIEPSGIASVVGVTT